MRRPRLAPALVLFLGLTGSPSAMAASVEDRPPNLLILMTDEHNFRTLGCYRDLLEPEQALMWGDAVVETPHIDRIAEQGAVCTSFYATSPVCSPSRGAFVTGLYPQKSGVVGNNVPLRDDAVTFATILGKHGYATGYAGKWHLDGGAKPGFAPERRFGFEDNRFLFNRGHWKKLLLDENGPRVGARNKKGRPGYGVDGADETTFTTDFLTDRALEFIREHRDQPFCYMVSWPDPHGPDTVRAPYDEMYAEQRYEKPRTYDVDADAVPSWARPQKGGYGQAKYYGMVKCIDDNVGRVLSALEQHGILDDTIIVFTSDHGDLRGEHHRHNKGVPFEASARIPFLVRAPGRVPSGTVVDQALGTVDFLPTILSLMKVQFDAPVDGRDASPLLAGRPTDPPWKDITFLRAAGSKPRGWLAAITDRYKLVASPDDPLWLFDLEQDPDELENHALREERRGVVRELARELKEYVETHGDPYGQVDKVRDDLARAIRKQ